MFDCPTPFNTSRSAPGACLETSEVAMALGSGLTVKARLLSHLSLIHI